MATYVIGDIHNARKQLEELLQRISPARQDRLYLLGDLFDRGGDDPDPAGVYFKILETGMYTNVTWIRGNHDQLLADYIVRYYRTPERKRKHLEPYRYNSFDLLRERLVEVDMLHLAEQIKALPLQAEITVGSGKYLLAHAMTFDPYGGKQEAGAYLEGLEEMKDYWQHGVEGYLSLVGHHDPTLPYMDQNGGYLDGGVTSVWKNKAGNLYLMDCGCGLPHGRLACMCLESGERFYA